MRTVRRLQDLRTDLRESRDRRELRQQHADLWRKRMSCADSVRKFTQSQDWSRGVGVSPSGRFRVIEDRQEKNRIFTREGIRWNTAWGILIAVAAVLAFVLLTDLSGLGITARNIDKLSRKIDNIGVTNQSLEAKLSVSAGDVSVCTKAVELNLIAANGATTIRLTAPENATMTFTAAYRHEAQVPPGEYLASGAGD